MENEFENEDLFIRGERAIKNLILVLQKKNVLDSKFSLNFAIGEGEEISSPSPTLLNSEMIQ